MKYRIIRTGYVLVTGLSCLYLAGCDKTEAEGPGQAPAQTKQTQPQTQPAQGEAHLTIDNFTFKPASLTIPAGTRVTWVNHDDVPHTVTANDGQFKSGALDSDQQFTRQFDRPGIYPYYCAIHTHMTGTIVVK